MNFIETILESNVINMIFVLMFLIWIFKKFSILSVIDKKKEEIEKEISSAELAKKESEKELVEAQHDYKHVDSETVKIKEKSVEMAHNLVNEILENSVAEVSKIAEKTEKIVKTESEKAKEDVSRSIAKAAVTIAEEHIKQSIDEETHNKFINEFIDGLDKIKV